MPEPYQIVVEHNEDEGHWFAYVPALPGRIVTGPTREQVEREMRSLVEHLLDHSWREGTQRRQERGAQEPQPAKTIGMLLAKQMPGTAADKTQNLLDPLQQLLAQELTTEERQIVEDLHDGLTQGLKLGEQQR